MFSNYDDFSEYYLKYNGELQIQEMKKDMEAFENEGGFNNHVIFLKESFRDMSISTTKQ